MSGGNGYQFYSQMSDSLTYYSQTVFGYPSSAPVKNILQYIDYELYCEPDGVSPSSCSPPSSGCRSPYMEWHAYKDAYLRLKSYFYAKARLSNSSFKDCKNCYIGSDNTLQFIDTVCVEVADTAVKITNYNYDPNVVLTLQFNLEGQNKAPCKLRVVIEFEDAGLIKKDTAIFNKGDSIVYHMLPIVYSEGWWIQTIECPFKPTLIPDPVGSCPCPEISDFYAFVQYEGYTCGWGNAITFYNFAGPVPAGRTVYVLFLVFDPYLGYFYDYVEFNEGEDEKEYCLGGYGYEYAYVEVYGVYCYDDETFRCPGEIERIPSFCPDHPEYEKFKLKVRRYHDYTNTSDLFNYIVEQGDNYLADREAEILKQCEESCEAQADIWINSLKGCVGGTSGTLDSLRQALINICKSGCASGNLMGTSDSIGGSATFESVIRQFYPSASDSCTAFLISSPYPKNKQPLYQRQSELYITSCLQQRFTALKNQYTASGFSGTLHEWFQMQLKDDYKLTEAELTSLETQLASGCKYLKRPLVLPVAMSCDADGITVEPSCVDSATVAGLLSGFSTMYLGLTSANERYEILITNYFNHSLGFALSYEDYDEYFQLMQTGTVNGQLLCARSQSSFDNTISEIETCMSSVFMSAYSSAINLYTAYIDSVRAAFRTAYFTKCLTATAGSSLKSTYLEYHYTLYYYDQSGNLVKTIPPEGVELASDLEIEQINQNRAVSSKYCYENSPYVNFTGTNAVDFLLPNGKKYFNYTNQVTIEAYVKLDNFNNQGVFSYNGDYTITGGVVENGFALLVRSGKLVLVSGSRIYSSTVKNERETPALTNFLNTGEWFHIAIVYTWLPIDPVRMYINGSRVPLTSLNSNSPYFTSAYLGLNNTPVKLGGAYNNGTTSYLNGGIKHFRMYTRMLGQAEIVQNAFNSCLIPASTSGLCCNIPFYEGTGNSPRDYIADLSGIVSSGSVPWANYVAPFYPEHKLPTVYEYNSLNQIVRQSSPDGDTTRFWYDALGRLVASQNEEQRDPRNTMANSATDRYSFTRYDQ
ncbi:MAG TPA: LamG-like jellyroll fold domain-containing protein, partial [Parasegetibacter sp.]